MPRTSRLATLALATLLPGCWWWEEDIPPSSGRCVGTIGSLSGTMELDPETSSFTMFNSLPLLASVFFEFDNDLFVFGVIAVPPVGLEVDGDFATELPLSDLAVDLIWIIDTSDLLPEVTVRPSGQLRLRRVGAGAGMRLQGEFDLELVGAAHCEFDLRHVVAEPVDAEHDQGSEDDDWE